MLLRPLLLTGADVVPVGVQGGQLLESASLGKVHPVGEGHLRKGRRAQRGSGVSGQRPDARKAGAARIARCWLAAFAAGQPGGRLGRRAKLQPMFPIRHAVAALLLYEPGLLWIAS